MVFHLKFINKQYISSVLLLFQLLLDCILGSANKLQFASRGFLITWGLRSSTTLEWIRVNHYFFQDELYFPS
jgi:hypothetical protein